MFVASIPSVVPQLLHRWCTVVALLFIGLATTGTAAASAPAPDQATAQYEIRFMEEMIDHHTMAVHMAMMCIDKAPHEELRTLCAQMRQTQSAEIAAMQSWLADWYGVDYEAQMPPGHEQHMMRMMQLSPEEFEMEFLKMMIRHHWKAVVEATKCTERAYHDELAAMCEDMVIGQSAEIETMRTWLCDWYGLCNYGPKGARLEG